MKNLGDCFFIGTLASRKERGYFVTAEYFLRAEFVILIPENLEK